MLQHLLDQEIHQYEAMIGVLNRKQAILVSGKPQPLHQADNELLALSRTVLQLEKQRLAITAQLGYPQCPLSTFIAHMPPERRPALKRRQERLQRAVMGMHRLNQDISDLLALSIQWIRETVELIASAVTPEGSSYTAQGSKTHATHPGAAMAPVQSTIIRSA
jgi:hypothetical protein